MIAKKFPIVNARRFGYSEMLRICGLLNDQVEEFHEYEDDENEDYDLTLAEEDEDYDEGESPLPVVTFHNFLPKLDNVRITLEAIAGMEYSAESREEAIERYLEAQGHLQQIKKHCSKVEKLITKRIGLNRKTRRTRSA